MQRKNILFVLIVFGLLSIKCGNNNTPKLEAVKLEIYGNWLLESLLIHADSTKSILGHKQFFCSEIIIAKNSDSVTIVNGDLEFWNTKCDSISQTEMAITHLSYMPHSNLYLTDNDKLFYYDSAAQKAFYFIRAVNNPIAKPNFNLTAMKYELNKHLFAHNFIDLETNKPLTFSPLNIIKGNKEFTNYQTFINNDMANMSEDNLMEWSNLKTKKTKLIIWKFSADTLKLFTTINTECKDCKPFYEQGVLWKTLVKKQ